MVAIVLFLCVIRMGIFDNSHKRNVTYHKIPSVPELKKLWLQRIRREEMSGYLSANDIINRIFKMVPRLIKRVYNALQTLGHWLRHVYLCIVLMTCKGPLFPDLHTSIWWPDLCIWRLFFTNYDLLAPFLKNWPLKQVFRGHFGPQVKFSGWNILSGDLDTRAPTATAGFLSARQKTPWHHGAHF